MKTSEMKIGTNGKGNTVYLVIVTINGIVNFIHYFDTMSEATNWLRWA